jgi:F-type H+-transporting ATPase subunit delta
MAQTGSTSIARPYARAIFDLAVQSKQEAEWLVFLEFFSTILSDSNLNRYLSNPKTSKANQALAIASVLKDVGQDLSTIDSEWATNLIALVIENQRLSSVSYMANLYRELLDQSKSQINIEVQSPTEPDSIALAALSEKLAIHYESRVEITQTLNPGLIGGVKVKANNTVIDGSIKNKLNKLTTWLSK